jgi:hypothetical protein
MTGKGSKIASGTSFWPEGMSHSKATLCRFLDNAPYQNPKPIQSFGTFGLTLILAIDLFLDFATVAEQLSNSTGISH